MKSVSQTKRVTAYDRLRKLVGTLNRHGKRVRLRLKTGKGTK